MSHPIGDKLEQELGVVIHHGQADVRRVWQHITGHHPLEPYDPVSSDSKETPVSILDSIRTDVENTLENHRAAVEDAFAVADKVAASTLAQSVLEGFAHVPPVLVQAAIDDLHRLEAEFAKIAPPPPDPGLVQ